MLAADVSLITSTRESGPLVAKESIGLRLPVVAVDVGDMHTWMEVYPAQFEDLADAIEKRLTDGQEVTLPANSQFENVRNQWSSLLESM